MRDTFIERFYYSKIQTKLFEVERDRDFEKKLQRAQKIIQKTGYSKRTQKFIKLRYSQDQFEYFDLVRAGYSNNIEVQEKFPALQTSLNNMASRFDHSDNFVCQRISKQRPDKVKPSCKL